MTFQFQHCGQTHEGYLETHDKYKDTGNTVCDLFSKIPECDEYERYATLSVRVDRKLPEGAFVFKTYSEHHGLYEEMLRLNLIKKTAQFVTVGFAGPQPVVELVPQEVTTR